MTPLGPPRHVLVAGDANLDLVLTGDVIPRFGQAEQLLDAGDLVLGGSAAIVACGLARLGVPTLFAARVGDDAFGRVALEALTATGVDTGAVEIDAEVPTGLSIILSAPCDRAILTVQGTIPMLRAQSVLDALGDRTHVHFASYFLQPGLAADLPELLRELRGRGVTSSLDTNWDPAERWEGLDAVLPLVDILFPNLEELRALGHALGAGSSWTDERIAAHLAALGPHIVVKAGADGGWSVHRDGELVRAPGLRVDVVDTTGAGDSFDGGYLAALAHGVSEERQRLRWATAAGSLSTRAVGGTGAQADAAELALALGR